MITAMIVGAIMHSQAAAQAPEPPPPPPSATFAPLLQHYQLDPVETQARFEVKFMGFITVRGKFNRTTGTLSRDPQLRNSAIRAVIDATTLEASTANARATNRVLRGPEFFHVEKFPTVVFASSQFGYEGERLQRIEGTLTLLGITRPVTLQVASSRCLPAEAERKARCEADAAVTIRRSDFGMLAWNESVADEVKIIVELVAIQSPPAIAANGTATKAEASASKPAP